MFRVLKEAVIVGLAAGLIALLANTLSPRGLSLTRDYFGPSPTAAASHDRPAEPASRAATTADAVQATSPHGFPLLPFEAVAALHADPRRAEGRIVFVDARNDSSFRAGHIPGAVQFDHYRMDRHVATVLPLAALAEQIVVYCNGGECEDSDLVATDLVALGTPAEKIVIYRGGFAEWKTRGGAMKAAGKDSP